MRILEKSPRRFAVVAKRLHGRPLPSKLRTYMWTESLYKAEREKLTHGANVERILRERYTCIVFSSWSMKLTPVYTLAAL